ncbi:hypothetical protein M5K25_026766 [Dendrobium thyrsiflorum]|uniref:Uncharacterized protein n=1 Tax=Dendrobium thyrsiflorum TaxID=117978 RepID=A0ABD0TYD4_DENTH
MDLIHDRTRPWKGSIWTVDRGDHEAIIGSKGLVRKPCRCMSISEEQEQRAAARLCLPFESREKEC